MNKIDLSLLSLIEEITPFYNKYRDIVDKNNSGCFVLELMWGVGLLLENYLKDNGLKPHALYWKIYGKADGMKNSYITRDFLSYCYRIKRFFKTKEEVSVKYSNLRRYSLFREAFPLLENSKYKLTGLEKDSLINLINSNLENKRIKSTIISIKKKKIGIKNDRKQKVGDMEPLLKVFISFYNNIYSKLKSKDDRFLLIGKTSNESIVALYQLVFSLSQENLFIPDINKYVFLPDWKDFVDSVVHLSKGDIRLRNRFRRLFSPSKIINLSEMIFSLESDDNLENYRKKNA